MTLEMTIHETPQTAPDPDPTATKHHIDVHSYIDGYQKQYGILQGNYANYREACTRRLGRLKHGKGYRKAVKAAAAAAGAVSHVNALWIVLTQAERAWSQSMDMKMEAYEPKVNFRGVGKRNSVVAEEKKASSAGKVRKHYLKRLKKACVHADCFYELCQEMADESTCVEAMMYASWMRGSLFVEMKKWELACEALAVALILCRAFEASEHSDLFTSRAEYVIDPIFQYCLYEFKEANNSSTDVTEEHIMQLQQAKDAKVKASQLAEIFAASSATDEEKEQSKEVVTVEWRGKTKTIANSSVRMILKRANKLENESGDNTDMSLEEVTEQNFSPIIECYEKAVQLIEVDIQKLTAVPNFSSVDRRRTDQDLVLAYMKDRIISNKLKRDECIASKLKVMESASSESGKIEFQEKLAKTYDSLVRGSLEKLSLPGGSAEDDFAAAANAHTLRYDAFRCYYIANIYYARSKIPQARSLFDHAISLATKAAEELTACEEEEHYVDSMISLEQLLVGAKCRAVTCGYLKQFDREISRLSLLQRINEYSSETDNVLLAHVPPSMVQLRPKPTVVDIARTIIEKSIDENTKKIDARQNNKSLFGWFG